MWKGKQNAVRNVLAKKLGTRVADKLTLTGARKTQGKVTSLNMVSQSMAMNKSLVASLKRKQCFETISTVHLSMLASVARTRFHSRYSVVYREGAAAHLFYVLVAGTLQMETVGAKPEFIKVVKARDEPVCFGVEGVAGGMPRLSTAVCNEESELLHFSLESCGRLDGSGVETLARRAFAAFVEDELKIMPLFFGLSAKVISEISCMFELREIGSASTTLFAPGMPAEELYILAKGRVALEDGDGTTLGKLTAGSVDDGYPFFGERALLKGGMRQDRATTTTPCKLLVIHRHHFPRLVKLMPHLAATLQEMHRLRGERAALLREVQQAQEQRRALERGTGSAVRQGSVRAVPDAESKEDAERYAAAMIARHTRGMLARKMLDRPW